MRGMRGRFLQIGGIFPCVKVGAAHDGRMLRLLFQHVVLVWFRLRHQVLLILFLLTDTSSLRSAISLYLFVKLRVFLSLHRSAHDLPAFLLPLIELLFPRCHFKFIINVVVHRLEGVGTPLAVVDFKEVTNLGELTGMVIIPRSCKVVLDERPLFDRICVQNCWLKFFDLR